MGVTECMKKWKRLADSQLNVRRLVIVVVTLVIVFMYIYPGPSTSDKGSRSDDYESVSRCLEDRLSRLGVDEGCVRHVSFTDGSPTSFLPFVGNGLFGVSFGRNANAYIRKSRTLSMAINWSPVISVVEADPTVQEAYVTDFYSGLVRRFQCFSSGIRTSYVYYAHRNRPNVFIQDIQIDNPTDEKVTVLLTSPSKLPVSNSVSRMIRVNEGKTEKGQYQILSGVINSDSENDEPQIVTIIIRTSSPKKEIEAHRSTSLRVPSTICVDKGNFLSMRTNLENRCLDVLKSFLNTTVNQLQLREEHVSSWHQLWETGLTISHSKAAGALNGNKINATTYYVLSQVLPHGSVNASFRNSKIRHSNLAEGCYGGYHHTLQAINLWKSPLSSFQEVMDTTSLWLLTLEKQGCHNLISTGVFGVHQAMVLSFGGFRFSTQHLEFKIDPKFLHRDYVFRRIHYDDDAYINVTVTLQDDNKAQLGVSLDKTDKSYYACDGGCMEEPVKLGPIINYFPVKMTDPITSILYITPDLRHMELIKDTLHVHKIVEAPAHDHHVIALHRHGHHLGGLPVLFWASICFLIVIFHLFLFKLIFNEYCDKQDKYKVRHGKM